MRVALFVTCVVDQFAPHVGRAAVRLLEDAGCEVVFPADQTCCGQPAYNSGLTGSARRLARHHIEVFAPACNVVDAIVAPSGSCAAMVRNHYSHLLPGDREAERIAAITYELTQFLVDIGYEPPPLAPPGREPVTYHASCHLLRELGVREAPRRLLSSAGIDVVEMDDAERCCGFGGTFSVTHPVISIPMADAKLDAAMRARVGTVVACDSGCLLHLKGRAANRKLPLVFAHVAEVVAP